MSGKEKSTDPGQSWAERKSAGEEAITDHEGVLSRYFKCRMIRQSNS